MMSDEKCLLIWHSVPVEPTDEMLSHMAGTDFTKLSIGKQSAERGAYRKMLAAAPAAPTDALVLAKEALRKIAGTGPLYDPTEDPDPYYSGMGVGQQALANVAAKALAAISTIPTAPTDAVARIQAGEVEDAEKALTLILPLAKGYAAAHRVGSNSEYISYAEGIRDALRFRLSLSDTPDGKVG